LRSHSPDSCSFTRSGSASLGSNYQSKSAADPTTVGHVRSDIHSRRRTVWSGIYQRDQHRQQGECDRRHCAGGRIDRPGSSVDHECGCVYSYGDRTWCNGCIWGRSPSHRRRNSGERRRRCGCRRFGGVIDGTKSPRRPSLTQQPPRLTATQRTSAPRRSRSPQGKARSTVLGDSIFSGNVGVTQNINVGGNVTASKLLATAAISCSATRI
jgi:hypothetical protein